MSLSFLKTDTSDYKSANCLVEYCSDIAPDTAEELVGKTIARIEALEYSFTLHFTDGSKITTSGHCWEDSRLTIEFEE